MLLFPITIVLLQDKYPIFCPILIQMPDRQVNESHLQQFISSMFPNLDPDLFQFPSANDFNDMPELIFESESDDNELFANDFSNLYHSYPTFIPLLTMFITLPMPTGFQTFFLFLDDFISLGSFSPYPLLLLSEEDSEFNILLAILLSR